ncbi:MAG TPA: protein phosphatase 2C domain-containing protein [Acidimicrobiales bacterium]|nr:protein phosphatase 2C domain-containing protein [Acidimicrobiales bacterium]
MSAAATATVAQWRAVAGSVVGAAHDRDGTPGQDAFRVHVLDDEATTIVAVADGAGSATEGGIGAAVAVDAAVDAAVVAVAGGAPPIDAANIALDAALVAVEGAAGDSPLGDFASTLAVAVVTRSETGAAVIGDSAIVVSAAGDLEVVTGEAGEYVNETTFLTSKAFNAARRASTVSGPIDGVAVFSDGLALLALDAATGWPHAPFFAPLFEFARSAEDSGTPDEALQSFLASPRVRERTDDDVTLALVAWRATDADG